MMIARSRSRPRGQRERAISIHSASAPPAMPKRRNRSISVDTPSPRAHLANRAMKPKATAEMMMSSDPATVDDCPRTMARLFEFLGQDLARLLGSEIVQLLAEFVIVQREDGHGKQCRVGRAGLANGERAHGNAAG